MSPFQQFRSSVRAKVVGFLFFLSVLADIFGVTDRLDALLPVVPALIPLIALFGTLAFGVLLVERIVWFVVDRRNKGPAGRKFMCLHSAIVEARELVEALDIRKPGETEAGYQGRVVRAYTKVQILEHELKQLGISMPPVRDLHNDKKRTWVSALSRIEGLSEKGLFEAAARFGEFWERDSAGNLRPLKTPET